MDSILSKDLEPSEEIFLLEQKLSHMPKDDASYIPHLHYLAYALEAEYDLTGDAECLDRAVTTLREIVSHRGAQARRDLGSVLLQRYELFGDDADSEEALMQLTCGLAMCGEEDLHDLKPDTTMTIAQLSAAHFRETRNLASLDRAIDMMYEQSYASYPPSHARRPDIPRKIVRLLRKRFEYTQDKEDLGQLIVMYQDLARAYPDEPEFLATLAYWLELRYQATLNPKDLDLSVHMHEEALDHFSTAGSKDPVALANLACAVDMRFNAVGSLLDLDRVISLREELADIYASPDTVGELADISLELARSLKLRYERVGDGNLGDLERCKEMNEQSLRLYEVAMNQLPVTTVSATSAEDIQRSIDLFEEIIENKIWTPSDRPIYMRRVALANKKLFHRTGNQTYIDKCIFIYKSELLGNLSPLSNSYHRSDILAELVHILWKELDRARPNDIGAYDGCISHMHDAIEHSKDGDVVELHMYLARTLVMRHRVEPRCTSLLDAMKTYATGAKLEHGVLSDRFNAAVEWRDAAAIAIRHTPDDAILRNQYREACTMAIGLLPQLLSLELDAESRLKVLAKSPGLAADGAAWLCAEYHACGKNDTSLLIEALELLEQGRAVFWEYQAQHRRPLDSIPGELGVRMRAVTHELQLLDSIDGQARREVTTSLQSSFSNRSVERYRRRRVIAEWTSLVADIRQLPGFRHFFMARPYEELAKAATGGPVVFLVAHDAECFVLVVPTSGAEPRSIKLAIDKEKVAEMNQTWSESLRTFGCWRSRGEANNEDEVSPSVEEALRQHCIQLRTESNKKMSEILDELWLLVVEPVVDFLSFKNASVKTPPRLWWCPTGPFVFLPLHAAGNTQHRALDYIVSSYTPTLQSLIEARSVDAVKTLPRVLAIVQPDPPPGSEGICALRYAVEEKKRMLKVIKPHYFVDTSTIPPYLTVEETLAYLSTEEISVAHFACHGLQDTKLDSCLYMSDGELTIGRMQGIHTSVRPGSLAFLSACQSAAGDEAQPDEAMHIAASMMMVGFQSVIGTMWTISDQDGPNFAEQFYKRIFTFSGGAGLCDA